MFLSARACVFHLFAQELREKCNESIIISTCQVCFSFWGTHLGSKSESPQLYAFILGLRRGVMMCVRHCVYECVHMQAKIELFLSEFLVIITVSIYFYNAIQSKNCSTGFSLPQRSPSKSEWLNSKKSVFIICYVIWDAVLRAYCIAWSENQQMQV